MGRDGFVTPPAPRPERNKMETEKCPECEGDITLCFHTWCSSYEVVCYSCNGQGGVLKIYASEIRKNQGLKY